MLTLNPTECDRFCFDAAAADRACRFIEKFLIHYEGAFVGEPFKLLPWQQDLMRKLFGWKRRSDGRRRFQELFLLTAKGAGKTPLLTAIGLYCLIADGEAMPHVISMASSCEQANLTFDAAKQYIAQVKDLDRLCKRQQYQIKLKKGGKWTIVSGKPTGRSGSRPSCLIADEAHEWEAPTAKAFRLVSANLFKRRQPLLLVATNAPELSTSFCTRLYNRAVRVATGKSQDDSLLPLIFEAPRELDWTSERAARAANPSMPEIITFEQLRPRLVEAMESEAGEAEYRRLYLSQQTQAAEKWLRLEQWDALTGEIPAAAIKDAVVYVGMDLSMSDDLSAVVYVFCTPAKMYVRPEFWMPQATAEHYDGMPYSQWAEAGHIHLVKSPTISPEIKREIADTVHTSTKAFKVKAVCYDRYKADDCVAALEAKGHVCVPVGQGWGVARGCEELDRRLKESSIAIANNPVLRACAEVVETKSDDHGNYWPVKPGAKTSRGNGYKGKRAAKIDGITALVTALTEARKHSFPAKNWSGQVYLV